MNSNSQLYIVHLKKEYKTKAANIFYLFEDLTVFKLTGADEIKCDFKECGEFILKFKERGIVYGNIIEIIKNRKIKLNWNVEGFGKPKEINTEVSFDFRESKNGCTLLLNHTEIKFAKAAVAKTKGWTEILDDMGRFIK